MKTQKRVLLRLLLKRILHPKARLRFSFLKRFYLYCDLDVGYFILEWLKIMTFVRKLVLVHSAIYLT